MSDQQVQEGDKVSWNWNGNHPSGTAAEVKAGEVSVTSHRGNEIKKTGDESNPAVHIERSGNDVVKTANELKVESNGFGESETRQDKEEMKEEAPKKPESNGEDDAKAGEKRKADEKVDGEEKVDGGEKDKEDPETKKQKTEGTPNGDGEKKKAGRPKANGAPKKEKKAAAVGKTERKTRSQAKA